LPIRPGEIATARIERSDAYGHLRAFILGLATVLTTSALAASLPVSGTYARQLEALFYPANHSISQLIQDVGRAKVNQVGSLLHRGLMPAKPRWTDW
jgi:hypothetical protein